MLLGSNRKSRNRQFTSRCHPHQGGASGQHLASPSGIAQEELGRRLQWGEQGRVRQRIPGRVISRRIVMDGICSLTKPGLPTSFRANHKNGFSKL